MRPADPERFDREVAPRCRPRYIGQERFYLREDLDAWRYGLPVDRNGTTEQAAPVDNWESFGNDLARRHQDGTR